MIVHGNPLFTGASGKLSNLVVKQYPGKIIIATVPDMSRRKLSSRQKQINERMRIAIRYAKHIVASPRQKERACELLQVQPNKVFRAIVKKFLLTDGIGSLFEETEQEKQDKQTLKALLSIIGSETPDAEVMLFGKGQGERATRKTIGTCLCLAALIIRRHSGGNCRKNCSRSLWGRAYR